MKPSNAVRTVWHAEAIDTSHLGFRSIQKIATIHASSGFIRGIPSKSCGGSVEGVAMRFLGPQCARAAECSDGRREPMRTINKLRTSVALAIALAAGPTLMVSPAIADVITFDLSYSGASFENSAVGTGFISFDNTVLPNTAVSLFNVSPATLGIVNFSISISNASSGNGTFGLSDFTADPNGWVWRLGGPLNLSANLVGQPNFFDFSWCAGIYAGQDYANACEWYEKAAEKGSTGATAQLEPITIRQAVGAGRYADALHLQEALSAKVEAAETKRKSNPGKETAEELITVAWYALFARDFTKALTVSDRAHALLPDELAMETNRAHALMFLERVEDCKALYLSYKGKPMSERDARLWEHVIAEDFAEFRKAGLTHPMMADIERELGVSP